MATHMLSPEELEDIRKVVGDDCGDPAVTDALVQSWFDATPDCMPQVYLSYLARLWAAAYNEKKNLLTLGNVTTNPKASGIEKMMAYWSKQPCVSATLLPSLSTGTLKLNIDSGCDADDLWP